MGMLWYLCALQEPKGKKKLLNVFLFSFGGEGVAGTSFGETGTSTVIGACLLELVLAFFGGGSTYPSSLHKKCVWLYQ
jgi:hypothetical protein